MNWRLLMEDTLRLPDGDNGVARCLAASGWGSDCQPIAVCSKGGRSGPAQSERQSGLDDLSKILDPKLNSPIVEIKGCLVEAFPAPVSLDAVLTL